MKKLLTVIFIILFVTLFSASSLYSSVDTKLVLVSNSHDTPTSGHGQLVFHVQAKSSSGSEFIKKFAGSVTMNANLYAQFESVAFSNRTFGSTAYLWSEGRASETIQYQYDLKDGEASVPISNITWITIVRITIQYTMTSSSGALSWGTSPAYEVRLYPSDADITGTKEAIPSDLLDIALPVQMSEFSAEYNQDIGVKLMWRTESETGCAGFHVLRSETEVGDFKLLTNEMIPGHGNTSSANEYSFTDVDVFKGNVYWYQIQIISEQSGDNSRNFFGLLRVETELGPVPEKMSLSQNFPNPFNPETTIYYEIPEKSHVQLRIYNLLGKEVRTLVDGEKEARAYTVIWDGADNRGRDVGSGIYFYKLWAGSGFVMRKMVKIE